MHKGIAKKAVPDFFYARYKMAKITVQNTEITVIHQEDDDFISLTEWQKANCRNTLFSDGLV